MTRTTCPEKPDVLIAAEEGIYGDVKAKHAFMVLSAIFFLFTVLLSSRLLVKHLSNYSVPVEQRQILRIIMIAPVYSFASLIQIIAYKAAPYIEPFPVLYEAFVLAAFFMLMVAFITPEDDEMKRLHKFEQMQRPARKGRSKPAGGLYRLCTSAVFQYCFMECALVLVEIVTEATHTFCKESKSPKFAHIWVQGFHIASVVICLIGLLRFYKKMKPRMADRGALHKFMAIKLLVFITVVQKFIFSFLIDHDKLNPSKKLSYGDITIGLPSLLNSFWMALFTVWFMICFSPAHYSTSPLTFPGITQKAARGFGFALKDSMNPRDLFRGILLVFKYVPMSCCGGRRRYSSDKDDSQMSVERAPLSPIEYNPHGNSEDADIEMRNTDLQQVQTRESVRSRADESAYHVDVERGNSVAAQGAVELATPSAPAIRQQSPSSHYEPYRP